MLPLITALLLAPGCAPTAIMEEVLGGAFHEVHAGRGVNPQGHLVRIYISPDNTFTILESSPDGVSCILGVGKDWEVEATSDKT
jgi:hypothetical protein